MRPTKATKGFDLSHDRPQLSMHDRPHCTQPFFTVIWNWPFHLPNISHIFNLFYKNKTTNSSTSGQNSFALKRIINSKLQNCPIIYYNWKQFVREATVSFRSKYILHNPKYFSRAELCEKSIIFSQKKKGSHGKIL